MGTRRYPLITALAAATAIACGGSETPQAPATPGAAKPSPSGIPVACIAKWTSGASGRFTCEAGGPEKNRAKIAPDTLRLDQICVNDPRLTSISVAGGKTVPLTLKTSGTTHCASLGGPTQLPETCTCMPPAGGDCTAPAGGFACIATGQVP
jgi:hypothetical protein